MYCRRINNPLAQLVFQASKHAWMGFGKSKSLHACNRVIRGIEDRYVSKNEDGLLKLPGRSFLAPLAFFHLQPLLLQLQTASFFSMSDSQYANSPFGTPSVVKEPFVLGGIADPVPWFDCQDPLKEKILHLAYLNATSYAFLGAKEVELQLEGSSSTWYKFYRLVGGVPAGTKTLPFVGWVPEAIMYIISSTSTEIRVVYETMHSRTGDWVNGLPDLSRAWYVYRLRDLIISSIPADNRRDSGPTVIHPECHAYVCWLARTAVRLPHNTQGREDFMQAFPDADLDMYSYLATDLGNSSFVVEFEICFHECPRTGFLGAMRTAQEHAFTGPWYGTSKTSGVELNMPFSEWRKVRGRGGSMPDAMAAVLKSFKFQKYICAEDCAVRPNWTDLPGLPNHQIVSYKWMEGFFPVPKTFEENRKRYPWPKSVVWYQKMKVSRLGIIWDRSDTPVTNQTASVGVKILFVFSGDYV